jgi:Ohr subfamily peroxiredoxin
MSEAVLYTASATAYGGRNGRVVSNDGLLDVTVVSPKELGGPGGATNPEQLFAAGYAACFHSALTLVARRARVAVDGSSVSAQVSLGRPAGEVGYALSVALTVTLPGLAEDVARDLVARADLVCPYSNATRGNIGVDLEVVVADNTP